MYILYIINIKYGFVFMNWKHLTNVMGEMQKITSILFVSMIMIITIISQIGDPVINLYGHIGGFFTGLFFIYLIQKAHLPNDGLICDNKYWRMICGAFLGIFFIVGFICFFTLEKFKY
jgi:hypothetical protein